MRATRIIRFFLLGALALGAVPAAEALAEAPAEPSRTVASSAITMPVLKTDEGVAYPRQALDEGFFLRVEVAVIVTVDVSGHVTGAVVEKSVGHGFDEAAVTAAQRLVFEPATRDGKAVAARTRFLYRFAPPPAVMSGRVLTLSGDRPLAGAKIVVRDALAREATQETTAVSGPDGTWRIEGLPAGTYHVEVSATGMVPRGADETLRPGELAAIVDRLAPAVAAAGPQAAEGEAVEEVEVRGRRPPREVTKRTLEQREINRIPGTNGDALRSLQNLPGVARPPPLSGLLIVRGSAPQDTQYFVDGTPVPIVYHFGGLSSVVPTEMIDRIDFYPGNFSAQFGRAMGGVVDVGLTDPKKNRLQAMAQVDLIDARVLAQGPILNTGWTFALSGRRSWFDVWLGPGLKALGANVSVAPVYYDYQALLERDLGHGSNVRFGFFGSDDRVQLLLTNPSSSTPQISGSAGQHVGFWRAQALYRNKISENTEVRLVGAIGQDFVDLSVGSIFLNITDWPITSRVELAQKLDKRLTMNVGFDMFYEPYTIAALLPPFPKAGQPPAGPFGSQPPVATSTTGSLYQPAFYTELEATPWAGGRIVPGIRLDYTKDTKSWDLSPRIVVRQDITRDPRTTLKAGVGLFAQPPSAQQTNAVFGTPGLTSNRSYHYDLGVEHELTRYIEASVEGFYKQLDHLVTQGVGSTGNGTIYGAETLIRYKPDARFFGWLAYTLSRSTRRDAPGSPLRLSPYDETHVLTVIGSYRLGNGWEFGARYRLTSGYMYTPDKYGFYDENVGTYLALQDYPALNSRLPLFHSLDLRVDKSWKHSWGTFSMYLDVLNVYNEGNSAGVGYDYNFTHSSNVSDLPFLPSLGFRAEL